MIGWGSPIPFPVGGGLTDTEAAYRALRDAVGQGGSAPDDTGIEGLWRRSEAQGTAAAMSSEKRAWIQGIPQLATDFIPSWERVLGIVPPSGSNEEQRRRVIVQQYYEEHIARFRQFEEALQRIDPRFSLRTIPEAYQGYSHAGRAFEAYAGAVDAGPDFNLTRRHVQFPLWSSRQIERIRFDAGYDGPLSTADQRKLTNARRLLRKWLGVELDFTISVDSWRLGVTPIGLGELGPVVDPFEAVLGPGTVAAHFGGDGTDWLKDISGNEFDLTSVGGNSPTYTEVDDRRAIVLSDDVILESEELGALFSGTSVPFSVIAWGQIVSSPTFEHDIWLFENSAGAAKHRGAFNQDDDFEVSRINDVSTFDPLADVAADGSTRFFGHAFESFASFNTFAQADDAIVADRLSPAATTFNRFRIGEAGNGQMNLARLVVINRFVTQAEMAALRNLFL